MPTETSTYTTRSSGNTPDRGLAKRYSTSLFVAGVTIVLAVGWLAGTLVSVTGEVGEFSRTEVPGEVELSADQPGRRVVYFERDTWFASRPSNPALTVKVTDPSGESVPVEQYGFPASYRLFGLLGEPVAHFEVKQAGTHRVMVTGEALSDRPSVAVGNDIVPTAVRGFVVSLGVFAVGMIGALALALRTASSRTPQRRT